MHDYVIMDLESMNRQLLLESRTPPRNGHGDHVPAGSPWSATPPTGSWTLLGLVHHATDWIVDLITLIHHGHMTCVWSVGPGPPRHRLDRGLVGTGPPRHRLDRGLIINKKTPKPI